MLMKEDKGGRGTALPRHRLRPIEIVGETRLTRWMHSGSQLRDLPTQASHEERGGRQGEIPSEIS